MAVEHISEAEAVRDFAGVLARVRAGQEVVIDAADISIAVLRPAARTQGRLLSESLQMAQSGDGWSEEPSMDSEFAADLEEIVRNRKPRNSARD